jgi:NADP-dependent aldehyde dehydrogenase
MNTQNLIGYQYSAGEQTFRALDPSTGNEINGDFAIATQQNVDEALLLAAQAFEVYRHVEKDKKAAFLRDIATEILALGDELIERAMLESGLPNGRLQGERGRTTGQLQMFADLVAEGSWVEAVIDNALPDRQPAARPNLAKMLIPLGPAVVFGASNFPLAFSVAGGDTAAALAAGCSVIVKAHPAHPGTSALVAEAIKKAAEKNDMPNGVFSILYDNGYTIGEALVKHPQTKIVTFTGSFKGGMALLKLAQERPEPIPVFTEMGSINPVLLLPDALAAHAEAIAVQYAGSITLGGGQFCTNPGLLLAVRSDGYEVFKTALVNALEEVPSATMLTAGICENYKKVSGTLLAEHGISLLGRSDKLAADKANQALAAVAEVSATVFLHNHKLKEEVFGPYSLMVVADDADQLKEVIASLPGQLTVTVMAEPTDLTQHAPLFRQLTGLAGRVILNNVPTGVEVCQAMQHGGPFPATSDSRYTSVGTGAIKRFVRPVCWQNWPDELLPEALKKANPLQIWRLVDNDWTKK